MIRSSFLSKRRDGDRAAVLEVENTTKEREKIKNGRQEHGNIQNELLDTPRQLLFSAFARTHFSPPSSPYGEYAAHVALCGSRECIAEQTDFPISRY
ncbi:Hypothetical protein, putative [Bodo saltans]|uniref:Uncharacterized protein n=1 Tax=Bodo saltans TaxID=75058 RepID=A0A0S4JCB7_BODSA|nr:Hypothetical protein, putative [Bodo saltans]|eukprot:CUG87801.1 Hypothetical protein, putative [Bodo saltans]